MKHPVKICCNEKAGLLIMAVVFGLVYFAMKSANKTGSNLVGGYPYFKNLVQNENQKSSARATDQTIFKNIKFLITEQPLIIIY